MTKLSDGYNNKRREYRVRGYIGKVDTRLDERENEMLNELANQHNKSRSEIVRQAIKDLYKFCTLDDEAPEEIDNNGN